MEDESGAHLIARLESEFRAARAVEDDVAADDLAFSLAQDLSLVDEVALLGGLVAVGEVEVPIDAVGHDYLIAGDWIVKFGDAQVVMGHHPPSQEPNVLLGKLRGLARSGAVVAVGAGGKEFTGPITKCAGDHLCLESGRRRLAIPLGRISYVRLVRGGSADAP